MIDKSMREATLSYSGSVLAIRMTGGPDCLWLNMYLDTEAWQMTCDSDVGSYAYLWGQSYGKNEDFIEFCSCWLANEDWLLRKCVGERHCDKLFNVGETVEKLREMMMDYYADDETFEIADFEELLDEAYSFSESAESWSAALCTAAERSVLKGLPEEWYECIVEGYTPQQKRFAEICREIIVPLLKEIVVGEERLLQEG